MTAWGLAILGVLAVSVWPPRFSVSLPRSPSGGSPPHPTAWRRPLPRGRRGTASPTATVLELVESMVPALEAGLAPAAALRSGARAGSSAGTDEDLLDGVRKAADHGDPLGPAWQEAAERAGSAELAALAAAWTLSESTGAPLAHAVRTTTGILRSAADQERRLASAVAGARATVNLLTVLPLGGPFVALALGIGPSQLYTGSVAPALSLSAGLTLAAAGRWWVARLVRDVAREPVSR